MGGAGGGGTVGGARERWDSGRGRGEVALWEGQEGGGAVGDSWVLLQVCVVSVRVLDCRATVWVSLSLQGSYC